MLRTYIRPKGRKKKENALWNHQTHKNLYVVGPEEKKSVLKVHPDFLHLFSTHSHEKKNIFLLDMPSLQKPSGGRMRRLELCVDEKKEKKCLRKEGKLHLTLHQR
jgi:hypothetical protein